MDFKFKKKNDTFSYYGMGKEENYCDMNSHAKIGMYSSSAKEEYVPYIKPQEHGNHTCTKLLKMDNGPTFVTNNQFEFRVSEFDDETLSNSLHTDEIKSNGYTNVRIDYKVSGIGSHSCGPVLDQKYQLKDKNFEFKFFIK